MKIAGYVGDLLYDYECVVIPGLGGFITNDKPAQVVAVTHHFKPPFREVHFNIHLKTNDGLLINYVAREEELSYSEAKSRVDQFSMQCRRALDNGKRIRFHGIGSLSRDHDQNIVFTQDKSVNYNPQAFGLDSFVSPAIARTSDEEKVMGAIKKAIPEKKVPKETSTQSVRPKKRMLATRKRSTFANQLIFLLVVFFMMGVGYVYMHRHAMGYYAERYASRIPFYYTDASTYFASNIDLIPFGKMTYYSSVWFPGLFSNEKNSLANENTPSDVTQATLIPIQSPNTVEKGNTKAFDNMDTEEPSGTSEDKEVIPDQTLVSPEAIEELVVTKPTEVPVARQSSTNFAYFIIAGAFNNETNALNLVKQLRSEGFDALVADTNRYGMFRVAYKGFHSSEEAANELTRIKNQHNPQAWILKK
jgi:cell division septation protein DedD